MKTCMIYKTKDHSARTSLSNNDSVVFSLHPSYTISRLDIVNCLLGREDIDVNVKCKDGSTPLHLAVAGTGRDHARNRADKSWKYKIVILCLTFSVKIAILHLYTYTSHMQQYKETWLRVIMIIYCNNIRLYLTVSSKMQLCVTTTLRMLESILSKSPRGGGGGDVIVNAGNDIGSTALIIASDLGKLEAVNRLIGVEGRSHDSTICYKQLLISSCMEKSL